MVMMPAKMIAGYALVVTPDKDTCGVCFGNNLSCAGCVANEVVELILVDAVNDTDIRPLQAVDTVIKSMTNPFSIVALVCSDTAVASVEFEVNGSSVRTENAAPYAIAGDRQGNYRAWNIAAGNYLVNAIPYSGNNGKGNQGIAKAVDLWVFDTPPVRSSGPGTNSISDEQGGTDGTKSGSQELNDNTNTVKSTHGPELLVYPNPTTGVLNVELIQLNASEVEIVLLDVTGKTIHQSSLEADGSEIKHELQLQNLPAGVYMLKLSIGTEVLTKRVIKE